MQIEKYFMKIRKIFAVMAVLALLSGCNSTIRSENDMQTGSSLAADNTENMGYTLYETKGSIETRPEEKYIMVPANSKPITFNRIDYEYKDDDFEILVKDAEGTQPQIKLNINGVDTENIDIYWSELKYIAFYDINKDGRKDIILKVVRIRSVDTAVLIANGSNYKVVKQTDDEFAADVQLLDGFKLRVDMEEYNLHKTIDLPNYYKECLILEGYISEEGKIIKIINNQSYYFGLVELEYYEVNSEAVMIKKYSLTAGKYNAGLTAICEYRYKDGEFVRSDVKFVEENYQYY